MRRKAGLLLMMGPLSLLFEQSAHAADPPTETAVKAAFLPRFARYVTWPASARPNPGEPFVLCTIGREPFGSLLDRAVQSQSVEGHAITVRRLSSIDAVAGCHMLYIGASGGQPTGQVLAAIDNLPILTITDASSGPQRGIIHFALVSGRVRFFIDEAAAARRGMTISSRLLSLAVAVRTR